MKCWLAQRSTNFSNSLTTLCHSSKSCIHIRVVRYYTSHALLHAMLTIISDNQLRLISDAITTIHEQLGELRSVMESSQTINFDGPAPAKPKAAVKATVTAPVKSKAVAKSHGKTHKSRGRGKRALTANQVLRIKQQLAEGVGATAISKEFKVHLSTVNCIKWGKTWKHVGLQQKEQESQPATVTIHS